MYLSFEIKAQNLELKAFFAEVVKLANTLRSGRSGRKSLRVQLPPSAELGSRGADKRRFSKNENLSTGLRRP